MEIIRFTKKIPQCPKCGGKKVKREFSRPSEESYCSRFRFLPDKVYEFLKLTCQSCFYQWAQEVKEK
jgi:hypothetical protein